MYFAIIMVFSLVINFTNLSLLVVSVAFSVFLAGSMSCNFFLSCLYVGHFNIKCSSSSTCVGQKGQNLISFGVIGVVCLPFSMLRIWFDSLNFVSVCLSVVLLMVWRYFSHPTSVFISAYVYVVYFLWH